MVMKSLTPRNEWYKIRLAYAMSIHKSQGSEFPVVILPITSASRRMLERNLIYTAITRAKKQTHLTRRITSLRPCYPTHRNCPKTYLIERFSDYWRMLKKSNKLSLKQSHQVPLNNSTS